MYFEERASSGAKALLTRGLSPHLFLFAWSHFYSKFTFIHHSQLSALIAIYTEHTTAVFSKELNMLSREKRKCPSDMTTSLWCSCLHPLTRHFLENYPGEKASAWTVTDSDKHLRYTDLNHTSSACNGTANNCELYRDVIVL